jgi:hypothetical protein
MFLLSLAVVGLLPPPLEMVGEADRQRERLGALIRDLDDDRFAVREKSSAELAGQGTSALPAVLHALRQPASLEVEKRLQQAARRIPAASEGNIARGCRLSLSLPRLRYRADETIELNLAVRKVDPTAPGFDALEGTDRPINRTSFHLRRVGWDEPIVSHSCTSDADVEVVQYSGEPPPSTHIVSCGGSQARMKRCREVSSGTPTDVIASQKVPLEHDPVGALPPGAYSLRLVYRGEDGDRRKDGLVSNEIFFIVEPADPARPAPPRPRRGEAKEAKKSDIKIRRFRDDLPPEPDREEESPGH